MTKIPIFLLTLFFSTQLTAQNLYPKKLDNCITTHFCLDCGDVKANIDKAKFEQLVASLNSTNNLKGVSVPKVRQLEVREI